MFAKLRAKMNKHVHSPIKKAIIARELRVVQQIISNELSLRAFLHDILQRKNLSRSKQSIVMANNYS